MKLIDIIHMVAITILLGVLILANAYNIKNLQKEVKEIKEIIIHNQIIN